MLLNSAVYIDGRRTVTPATLEEVCRVCHNPGKFAWISLYDPTEDELAYVVCKLGLDELAIEEMRMPQQRPKLEQYGDGLFAVLKLVRYGEDTKRIEYGEIHAFVEQDFILTACYGEDLASGGICEVFESKHEQLPRSPAAILYKVLELTIESYDPVIGRLENDLDEIETEVFGGNASTSRRIHELSREVVGFHQVTKPLAGALDQLLERGVGNHLLVDPEMRKRLRRLRNRVLRVAEQIEGHRDVLSSILDVNLTMVGVRQNDQMRKISAWGAILVIPTLIAGIFGMNFEEAWWIHAAYGFEIMIVLMLLISVVLYASFKRSGWL